MMQPNANPQVQTQQGIAALPVQGITPTQSPMASAPAQPQQMQQTPEQILALLKQANDAKAAELAQREMALNQQAQPTVMAQLQQKAQRGQAAMQQMRPQQAPGIDNLPSNIQMAGGGIVGFAGGGEPMTEAEVKEPQYSSVEDNLNTRHPQNETSALNKLRAMLAAGMDITKVFRDVKTRPTGLMPYSEGESRRRATENMDPRDFAAKRSAPMQQASYSNEGRSSTPPEPTLGQTVDPGIAGFAQLRAAAERGDPDAVKALALFSAKYPESANARQGVADRAPTSKPAGDVADDGPSGGIAGILRARANSSGPREGNDIGSAAEAMARKLMNLDPDKQRDADAQYVKDNSGVAAEMARRGAAMKGLTAGQEAIKASRPTGIRELLLNMAEQGKANRGFRNESPFSTLLGDRAAAGVAMNKNQQNNAKADYDMLVAMNKQGDADAAVQLGGNRDATEAGLKGADRARAQQTAGMQAATTRADTLDRVEGRKEEVALRMADVASRAKEVAQARGDNQLYTQLTALEKSAQAEGSRRAAAEAKMMGNMDLTEINSRAATYAAEALMASTTYKAVLAKLGIEPLETKGTPTPTPGIDLSDWGQLKAK